MLYCAVKPCAPTETKPTLHHDEVELLRHGLGKYKPSPKTETLSSTASDRTLVVDSANQRIQASNGGLSARLRATDQLNRGEEPSHNRSWDQGEKVTKPRVVRFATVNMVEMERNEQGKGTSERQAH